MDLDDQARIQQVVDRVGSDDLVVLLGSPNPESAELYAATVTLGDPTFAGPLAGIPLGLPCTTCSSLKRPAGCRQTRTRSTWQWLP